MTGDRWLNENEFSLPLTSVDFIARRAPARPAGASERALGSLHYSKSINRQIDRSLPLADAIV